MRARLVAIVMAVAGVGCGASVVTSDGAGGDDQTADAPPSDQIDAPPGGPDAMLGPWSAPMMIPAGGTDVLAEDDPGPSAIETELLFSGKLPNINKDIYLMTRQSDQDPWGPSAAVGTLNTTATEQTPRITDDGTTLYFSTSRNGGPGADDIWMATRSGPGAAWGMPVVVPAVNSGDDERTLTPCAGNRYVVISFQNGTGDFFEGVFGQAPTLVAELSDPNAQETGSFVSADCLRAWFASTRDGSNDIFYAHRATPTDPWILDGKVTELSTDNDDESDPWISPDGHRMVFTSNADAENDLYTSSR